MKLPPGSSVSSAAEGLLATTAPIAYTGPASRRPGVYHREARRGPWWHRGATTEAAVTRREAMEGTTERTPQEVFQHHVEALGAEDLEGIVSD